MKITMTWDWVIFFALLAAVSIYAVYARRNPQPELKQETRAPGDMRGPDASADYANANMAGYDMRGSVWSRNTLTDCNMSCVDMRGMSMHRVTFKGCNLAGADMRNVLVVGCSFIECDLTGNVGLDGSFVNQTIFRDCKGKGGE